MCIVMEIYIGTIIDNGNIHVRFLDVMEVEY